MLIKQKWDSNYLFLDTMDKGKIQKIYSRRIPRIKYFKGNNEDNNDKQKIKKIFLVMNLLKL